MPQTRIGFLLDHNEASLIAQSLRQSCEQWASDAELESVVENVRLVDQFKSQISDAEALLDKLEKEFSV